MKTLFVEIGYTIEYRVLSANEYGVLQNRKRIILVGKKVTVPKVILSRTG